MKIPLVDNILEIVSEGLEFANSKEERQRKAVIRSAKKVVKHLKGFEVPKDARHYVDQMEIRLGRLT